MTAGKLQGSTVLVTGGAGLIGSHIIDQLVARGVTEIRVLDNFVRGRRDNLSDALRSGVPITPTMVRSTPCERCTPYPRALRSDVRESHCSVVAPGSSMIINSGISLGTDWHECSHYSTPKHCHMKKRASNRERFEAL